MIQHDDVGEIELDRVPDHSENLFDAICEDCGTVDRFNTPGKRRAIGETFEIQCYSCNSGEFPELGETTRFRVLDLSPNPDNYPNELFSPPVYTSNEPE